MIQHCLSCDRPMHLRGGDMTTTCAECRERENPSYTALRELQERLPKGVQIGWPEHPLPRSEPHDLDARALKARLEDRERVIAAFRERCQKLEAVAEAARETRPTHLCKECPSHCYDCSKDEWRLSKALAALDAKEST